MLPRGAWPEIIGAIADNAAKLYDIQVPPELQLPTTAAEPMQPGDVPDTVADVQDLASVVGYKPRVTVEEGVRNFVDWYRGYNGVL